MKSVLYPFGILLLVSALNSCDNEIDVNAPWKEITVAYGLMDFQDSVHHLKINKAYLNQNRDAREIAKNNPDSIYHDHKIDVKLQAMSGGTVQETYELRKDTLHNKEPGLFAYPDHIMYRNETPFHPNPNLDYRLKIDSLKGEPVTANTSIVGPPLLTRPRTRPGSPIVKPPFGINEEVTFRWQVPPDARFFSMNINTIYYETGAGYDTVEWTLFRFLTSTSSTEAYEVEGAAYFEHLGNQLAPNPDINRPADSIRLDIKLSAGGEALYQYYRVNRPSISIVQKKPDYTNVNNGRGLFSSKSTITFPGALPKESKDSLVDGRYTKDLNFTR